MASLVKSFRAYGGSWNDSERALADSGMGYAVIDATGTDLILYDLDLEEIPTDATVQGIQVRIDAYKEETDGSGTLWVAAELSWDSGSTYTSTAYKTANLTTSEVTTNVGGVANTWGHSWTRAELDDLRLRLRSGGSAIVDTPDWRVDFAQITIYYTDTTTLQEPWSETLHVDDTYAPNRIYAPFEERVTARDGRESPRSPQAAMAGDVLDELQALPADWVTATTPRNADTCMLVEMAFLPGFVFQISDDANASRGVQEGVLAWDSITYEGAAGVETSGVETGFTIRNGSYAPMQTGFAPIDMSSWLNSFHAIGSQVSIYAQAYYGGAFFKRLVFRGNVTNFTIGETATEFRISLEDKENLPVPAITITPTLFNYGTDEGTMPKSATDQPVPVAFGRFDPTALRTDWSANNPLSLQNQGPIIGAAMGLRFPMVPVPLVSDRYRIQNGLVVVPNVTVLQSMFGFGDTAAGIVMTNKATPWVGTRSEFQMSETFADLNRPVHVFTWDSGSGRAFPFNMDGGAYLPQFYYEQSWSGAGQWQPVVGVTTTAPIGARLQVFHVTRTAPVFSSQFDGQWLTCPQSAWVSPKGFTQYGGSPYPGTNGTPGQWFTTPAIANPRNALSTDLDSFVTVAAGQQLGLHFSGDGQSPITGMRVWVIYNGAQSGHAAKLWYRSSWRSAQAMLVDLNTTAVGVGEGLGVILDNTPAAGGALNAAVGYLKRQWSAGFGVAGDYRLTFMDNAVNTSQDGDKFPFEPEVLITCTSGSVKIAHVFLELQFASDLAFEQTKPVSGIARRRKQGTFWDKMFNTDRSVKAREWTATQNGVQKKIEPLDSSTVFITGRSKVDTTPKQYTGTDGSLIEVAPDIGQACIDIFGGDYTNVTKTGFGSFVSARTILAAKLGGDPWALSACIDQQSDLQDTLDLLAANSMSFCQRQVSDTGTLVWRWFVDSQAPHTDDSSRLYRTNGFLFDGDTIMRDSVRISSGDATDVYSDFTLKWGLHQPSGEFAGTMFVNNVADNLISSGSAYRTKCNEVVINYGIKRPFVIEAPWVWREKIADKLLKWHVDSRRLRRHLIEFSTGPNALDLQPGHVIRFADRLSTWVKYPGVLTAARSSAAWSTRNWVVVGVTIESEPLQQIRLRVTAIETFQE